VDEIALGNGSIELIRIFCQAILSPGDKVRISKPTFGEYEFSARLFGALPTIGEEQAKIRFICNPNNPTGKYLSYREIEAVVDTMGDSLLVLDEAYVDFVEAGWNSNDLMVQSNTIILRSMTKNYGLPGIRLGYAVARREIIDSLRRVCPPWNVNAVAQKIGLEALVFETGPYGWPEVASHLIKSLGKEVNLENVDPNQVVVIDNMRRGLERRIDHEFLTVRRGRVHP
jgi:histidinol-phosphate aminotransferase